MLNSHCLLPAVQKGTIPSQREPSRVYTPSLWRKKEAGGDVVISGDVSFKWNVLITGYVNLLVSSSFQVMVITGETIFTVRFSLQV